MTANKQILKQKQSIARSEQSLALKKLKKRRADTRRKIELGGLIIKAGIDGHNKALILGTLLYGFQLMAQDINYQTLFESIGENAFQS